MAIKKVKLPNNTVVDINDSRIPGVDSTPTSGSTNVVTSGGVKTALDEATVTEATVSGWGFTKNTGTLTGVSFNGTTAPVSGGVASISVTIPAAPGTLNTTATTEQSTRASEALSGSITLHKISKTGSYSDLSNKPTIDSSLSSQSSNAIMNSAVDGEFVKVSYIGDVVESVDPIEPEPEPEPVIVIGGGGIEAITFNGTPVPVNESTKTAAITASIPTESTVSGWGFTKNTGTVTQVKVGTTEYNPSSGVVSLPAYPTTLPASDVSAWAKASTKPTYTASEVGALPSTTSIPTESTVSGWGFTKNAGTITGITMNGSSKGTSGTVNLGTVVTAETDPVFSASAAHGISSTDISNWNAKQKAITVSSSEPTSSQGSNGDIWIVI